MDDGFSSKFRNKVLVASVGLSRSGIPFAVQIAICNASQLLNDLLPAVIRARSPWASSPSIMIGDFLNRSSFFAEQSSSADIKSPLQEWTPAASLGSSGMVVA